MVQKRFLRGKVLILLSTVLVGSIFLAGIFVYHLAQPPQSVSTVKQSQVLNAAANISTTDSGLAVSNVDTSGPVLGVNGDPKINFAGIPWVRLSYPTCFASNLQGDVLKSTIAAYHAHTQDHPNGVKVMLTICQQNVGNKLLPDQAMFNDAAQGGADAVQCGNEQMKQDKNTTYVTPQRFALFYYQCEQAIHNYDKAQNLPNVPAIVGAMDPLVARYDTYALSKQVAYLDAMEKAMNTSVLHNGNWHWRSQIVGLIDSWHNGWSYNYPDLSINNLRDLFHYWQPYFTLDPRTGRSNGQKLGDHLWVIEGTGCFIGCGINESSPRAMASSHIITLIVDVQTTLSYGVPFFYFSGKDFYTGKKFWPMGVLDFSGNAKPLRQDLSMRASPTLQLSCNSGPHVRYVLTSNQEQLLALMYQGCRVPSNYYSILSR